MKVSFAKPGAAAAPQPQPQPAPAQPTQPQPQPQPAPAQPTQPQPQPAPTVNEVPAAARPVGPAVPTPAAQTPAVPTCAAPAQPAQAGPLVTTDGNKALPVAVAQPQPRTLFFDDENIDPGDLVLPRLNIVQKVGELSNVFTPGALVLNGQLVLTDAPATPKDESKPINLLVIGFRPKQFVEKVEGSDRGNFFNTEAEVIAAGGTTDYNLAEASGKSLYQPLATAMCLIEQPEGLDAAMFPHPFGGKNYTIALWSMKGTAFTNGAKHFYSARKIGHLRSTGYKGGWWKLSTRLKQFKSNYAYIPVVRPGPASSEEFRAWLTELLGF